MNSQDLLIVARRFWPHSGLTELALADLARNLSDAGHCVTVATIQSSRDWSENISYHGIPVVRFARPVAGPWSSFRYARSLATHFATKTYDGIIVSGFGDEAAAVIRSASEFTPVVLHIDEGYDGAANNIHAKHVDTCIAADAVIATSNAVANHLKNHDGMPDIDVVRPGTRHDIETVQMAQIDIRAALSNAHPVVKIEPAQPLVVSFTRMSSDNELIDLVHAWPFVLNQFPGAKLWLLGDGKHAGRIWQSIVELDLCYSILLPGFFDDPSDVFAAADLYIHSAGITHTGDGLIRSMAFGLAPVATANDWTGSLIESSVNGLLAPTGNRSALAKSILYALSNNQWRKDAGMRARETVADHYLPKNQVDGYLELLANLSSQNIETAQ